GGASTHRVDGVGPAPHGQNQRRSEGRIRGGGQVPADVLQPGDDPRVHRGLARVWAADGYRGEAPRVRRRRLHDADPQIRVVGPEGSARASTRRRDAGGTGAAAPYLRTSPSNFEGRSSYAGAPRARGAWGARRGPPCNRISSGCKR